MLRFFLLVDRKKTDIAIEEHLKWLDSKTTDFVWYSKNAMQFYTQSKQILELNKQDSPIALPKILNEYAIELSKILKLQNTAIDDYTYSGIEGLKEGYMQAVYSLSWPETKKTILYESNHIAYDKLYSKPYIQNQDTMHKEFLENYKQWVKPVVKGRDKFKYSYPTNGSSEAIKYYLAYNIKTLKPKAKIHIFKGEYQGVNIIAQALGIEVKEHERNRNTIDQLDTIVNEGDFFYISQPSGIDGNLWKDYEYFLSNAHQAKIKVMLDLAYEVSSRMNIQY